MRFPAFRKSSQAGGTGGIAGVDVLHAGPYLERHEHAGQLVSIHGPVDIPGRVGRVCIQSSRTEVEMRSG